MSARIFLHLAIALLPLLAIDSRQIVDALAPLSATRLAYCWDVAAIFLDGGDSGPSSPAQLRACVLLPLSGADLFLWKQPPCSERATVLRHTASWSAPLCLESIVPRPLVYPLAHRPSACRIRCDP